MIPDADPPASMPMPAEPSLGAIVYASTAAGPLTADVLEALLMRSRRLNWESDITGALIYSGGRFMQYLEGPRSAVDETYQRIRASRLHSRMVELMNGPVAGREFPSWQMALAQPPLTELLGISTAAWVVQDARAASRGRTTAGLALLREFWRRSPAG